MGLTFVMKDLNMAAKNCLKLQKIDVLENKVSKEHLPKVVFGTFYVAARSIFLVLL